MGLVEFWAIVGVGATIVSVIIAVGAYVVIRVEKFDDRLRGVELQVARLDERTRQGVVTVRDSRNINVSLPGGEE